MYDAILQLQEDGVRFPLDRYVASYELEMSTLRGHEILRSLLDLSFSFRSVKLVSRNIYRNVSLLTRVIYWFLTYTYFLFIFNFLQGEKQKTIICKQIVDAQMPYQFCKEDGMPTLQLSLFSYLLVYIIGDLKKEIHSREISYRIFYSKK